MLAIAAALVLPTVLHGAVVRRLGEGKPPERAEVRGILGEICSPDNISKYRPGFSACSRCPSFTGMASQADEWVITAIHYGGFKDRNADEAALGVRGCEPHSNSYGGALLFQRTGQGWKLERYDVGRIIDDCLPVRRDDGRDVLVCQGEDSHQGVVNRGIYSVDLRDDDRFGARGALLGLTDDADTCGDNLMGNTFRIQSAEIRKVRLESGRKLIARVEFGTRTYTPDETKKCLEAERREERPPKGLLPVAAMYQIVFQFDGSTWHVTQRSRQAKLIVEAGLVQK